MDATGGDQCLLCLLDIDEKQQQNPLRRVKDVLKLITKNHHQKLIPYEEKINFCPDCILIVDSATEIHDQIVRLEEKLGTQIELIRNKILNSNNKNGNAYEKLKKLRRSLLSLSG
jgi:hypothetical protein